MFDHRVTVDQALQKGSYELCHGCGWPVSAAERESPHYEEGVCCPHCAATVTDEQKARFRERRKQIELARARGEQHIGVPMRRGEG